MWKINTFEALELAGRRGVGSVVKCPAFVPSPSLSSCDCMCSFCQWMLMLWILSLGALSNTHAIGHKYTATHTHASPPLHIHKQLQALSSGRTSVASPASQLCVLSLPLWRHTAQWLQPVCLKGSRSDFTSPECPGLLHLISFGLAHLGQSVQEGVSTLCRRGCFYCHM